MKTLVLCVMATLVIMLGYLSLRGTPVQAQGNQLQTMHVDIGNYTVPARSSLDAIIVTSGAPPELAGIPIFDNPLPVGIAPYLMVWRRGPNSYDWIWHITNVTDADINLCTPYCHTGTLTFTWGN